MSSDRGKHGLEKGCFSPALAQEQDRACPLQERVFGRFGVAEYYAVRASGVFSRGFPIPELISTLP